MKSSMILAAFSLFSAVALADAPANGQYTIPVKDESLKPYATFPIVGDLSYPSEGTIEFSLPKSLTGRDTRIAMTEVKPGVYQGPQVEATCAKTPETLTCHVEFRDLEIDSAAAAAEIRASFPDPVEAEKRVGLQLAFASEPIGVFVYVRTEKTYPEITSNHIIGSQD